MFYETRDHHGLPHNPFKSLVLPRPIGWISTRDREGRINLAPYSFFNAVASDPPIVMFAANGHHADGGIKDSARNAEDTGEFVANLATWDLRDAMNASSAHLARGVDEFEVAGLTAAPCRLVGAPRVLESPVSLECRTLQIVELPGGKERNRVVFGQVAGIHIDDAVLRDGIVDVERMRPIARLGYHDYTVVERIFSLTRP
jgi:flavin reductase (DIM6/NTAB) family NADH-FMN oxidoreductase RutF